jgi:rhodanese-related sulfurtransferase
VSGAELRLLSRDALMVAALGVVIGLGANAISPRGISLTRDYFAAAPSASRAPATSPPTHAAARDPVRERLAQRGLKALTHDEAVALFRDPRRTTGQILFIDARDDAHYEAGHIPGAQPFDHYRLERYIANVVAIAPLAEQIVVYCHGGECEDSELVAIDLTQLGVPASKLAIYLGGITEWERNGLPVETGARGGARSSP